MLAPSTRPSATGTGSSAGVGQRRDQQHDRQARVRQHRQHRADDDVEQHVVRQRDQQRAHRRRLGQRPGRGDDQLQRERDQAEADQDAADRADAAVLARDEDRRRRRRSAAATATTGRTRRRPPSALVPTSAPSITASAALVVTRSLPTNEATIRQVAVLDWTMLVTPRPASSGAEAVGEARREDAAQVLAEHPQHAGAHDVRAPDEQGDRGEQVEERRASRCCGPLSSRAASRS